MDFDQIRILLTLSPSGLYTVLAVKMEVHFPRASYSSVLQLVTGSLPLTLVLELGL